MIIENHNIMFNGLEAFHDPAKLIYTVQVYGFICRLRPAFSTKQNEINTTKAGLDELASKRFLLPAVSCTAVLR